MTNPELVKEFGRVLFEVEMSGDNAPAPCPAILKLVARASALIDDIRSELPPPDRYEHELVAQLRHFAEWSRLDV